MENDVDVNEAMIVALAAARKEMKSPAYNKVNPHYRSKYADLSSVLASVTGPLSAHDIVLTQTTKIVDGGLILVTRLMHKDGGEIVSEFPLTPTKPDLQTFGAAMTYARRYSISAICALAAEEDTDAEEQRREPTLSSSQLKAIEEECQSAGIEIARFWNWATKSARVKEASDIPAHLYGSLVSKIDSLEKETKEANNE
jgi:hypothetical protein